MTFFRSILLLTGLCLFIMLPYSLGHALSTHTTKPIVVGLVCGALSVGLFFVLKKDSSNAH